MSLRQLVRLVKFLGVRSKTSRAVGGRLGTEQKRPGSGGRAGKRGHEPSQDLTLEAMVRKMAKKETVGEVEGFKSTTMVIPGETSPETYNNIRAFFRAREEPASSPGTAPTVAGDRTKGTVESISSYWRKKNTQDVQEVVPQAEAAKK